MRYLTLLGVVVTTSVFGNLPFDEFTTKFKLGSASTEQLNPHTMDLSQAMQKDFASGANMLLKAEEAVLDAYETNYPRIAKQLVPRLKESLSQGGRIFLIGSGSSGRVAIDLAARAIHNGCHQVEGVIAGSDTSLVRAKETFEDSIAAGHEAMYPFDLRPEDTLILISGSGSASFNVGAGHAGAECGATTFYFYNSQKVPARTQTLFDRQDHPTIPLCVDVGAQSITGSTRLQSANTAQIFLGTALAEALDLETNLLAHLRQVHARIRDKMWQIESIVQAEFDTLNRPDSNFRSLTNTNNRGLITFLADESAIREVFIDTTETAPTFSTHPPRKTSEHKRRPAEFRAYLNYPHVDDAWAAMLGRPSRDPDSDAFLLSSFGEGVGSFFSRIEKGNTLIRVAKVAKGDSLPIGMWDDIAMDAQHCTLGTLLICEGEEPINPHPTPLKINLENVHFDTYDIVPSYALKLTLNLLSNSTMVKLNKVYGNRMIDVSASNNKLIDRTMRLVRTIWKEHFEPLKVSDEDLYQLVLETRDFKVAAAESGIYTPSAIKLILNKFHLNCSLEDAAQATVENNERLLWEN